MAKIGHAVKGIKIKISAKSRASRRLGLKDTKGTFSPEMHLKSHGTFKKWAPGVRGSQKNLKSLRARKANSKTPTHLFCKAGLFVCCKGNKN